ncbi:Glycosyltransferase involved in cell wall bisynthesis [Acetomicrobium flavidum]|uniref:Glycosyltransferase involved in cell wall bisynthesis n=1 Tax=Acetomicrobium flavidum TaxID=49896 RepID=A0ABY1JFG2_9BACT|nr:Glycosyltransferase involved in cell wall bisynthesis [Acetomicrobium flavidum]
MSEAMVFHHPFPIVDNGRSGSQVRPYQMLQAFRALGYDVELVAGYAKERKQQANMVREQLSKGRKFSFVYSESTSMPTLLTEPNHFPITPKIDFGLFSTMKAAGIPIGLYYRDIHWKFEVYKKQVSWYKRIVAIQFYKYDWMMYKKTVDVLFVPSYSMAKVLPTSWSEERLGVLPPGCIVHNSTNHKLKTSDLHLFYVGGVMPPTYNLKPMIDLAKSEPNIRLTICCRLKEWEKVKEYYCIGDNARVSIVHASGDELAKFYEQADLFLLLWTPYSYLDFAVPVKLLESLGYGLPVLTTAGTEAARFVAANNIGWVVNNVDEARHLLRWLRDNPAELVKKRRQVMQIREQHTWLERPKTAAKILTSKLSVCQDDRDV